MLAGPPLHAATNPDLTVTNLAWSGVPTAGQDLQVYWTVNNAAAGFAYRQWPDMVFLSTNATLAGQIASWRSSEYVWHNVGPGGAYANELTAHLPNVAAGNYYLIAAADAWNLVFESDEGNNLQTLPITLGVTDLAATNLTLTSVAIAARNCSFSWTVRNESTNNYSGFWYDRITLSSNASLNGKVTA